MKENGKWQEQAHLTTINEYGGKNPTGVPPTNSTGGDTPHCTKTITCQLLSKELLEDADDTQQISNSQPMDTTMVSEGAFNPLEDILGRYDDSIFKGQ